MGVAHAIQEASLVAVFALPAHPATDLLARYGGEEFVLLLPACALEDAVRIVERPRSSPRWSPARSGWPAELPGGRQQAGRTGRPGPRRAKAKAKGRNRNVLAS